LKVKRFSLILLLVMALPACSRIENMGVEETVQLRFDPVILAASKADVPGEYPADVPFGVQVWDYDLAKEPTSGTVLLDNAQVTFTGGEWVPGNGVLWPGMDRNLAVLAYSPYGRAASVNLQEGIRFEAVNTDTDQTDLLYTDLRQGLHRNNDGGVVNLPFRHALCYVDFAIRTNALESERVEVRSLSLLSLYTEGDFQSLPEPGWSLTGTPHKVTFYKGLKLVRATNTLLPDSGAWVLPQAVKSIVHADLDYTAPNGDILPYSIESEPLVKILEPGRHYTIILSYLSGNEVLEVDEIHRQGL
jgi:hypothetical protein